MNAFEAAAENGREAELQAELETSSTPEHERQGGCHLDSGDVPARDGDSVAARFR